ncbi:hypothetical protein G7K71_08625 [Desulfofundulus sp. TPOSR]|uniref:hypothetical protein n=1 Tax=Desulfofundulus sp. TPOSR TaxID=2714340 RepID=UPI00140A2EA7|nr:hypothetical protein [Desulfofundulus sp. TPOSR]NHM25460.1 hypothetical protein [Desulfofundulus sp. TPOSR]NHM27048.1 hypothetical protein [Desulfofundulus sp. TPOSR]
MPKKDETQAVEFPQGELLTIEELAARHSVPAWTMAGLKVAMAWGQGKRVSEQEFLEALTKWLSGPMSRR